MAAPTMTPLTQATAASNLDLEDDTSTLRRHSLDLSDAGNELDEDNNDGDYSARMDEILSDGDGEHYAMDRSGVDEDDEDEEGFVYDGADAEPVVGGYREQMRAVLGADHEEDEVEERHVEKVLLHAGEALPQFNGDAPYADVFSSHTLSEGSRSISATFSPPRMLSPGPNGTPSKLARPFLHPTVSRLRSFTPASPGQHFLSPSSVGTVQSHFQDGMSPSPSHFSAMSRSSSTSNLRASANGHGKSATGRVDSDREVFRWTELRSLSEQVYFTSPQKASAVLGAPKYGSPMVIAANGLICVGTDLGRILVFDFKQNLKCVCGTESSASTVGPITALALSNDHTFVAAGHAFGHIQLFDLKHPQTPARLVIPTSLAAVASGRQEGHLLGSRIVNIGFIAGRHTAVVSADDVGLAFYHSLGKVLFVDASDVLRILGKYPEDDPPLPASIAPPQVPGMRPKGGSRLNGNGTSSLVTTPTQPWPRKQRRGNTILSMAPLPLGTSPHPTDAYQLVALLTPVKLVIAGLKPSPKTWFRRHRDGGDRAISKSKWNGTLAWFPSVLPPTTDTPNAKKTDPPRKSKSNGKDVEPPGTIPMLIFSWGASLFLMRVYESKLSQSTQNHKTGKTEKVEIGKIEFEDVSKWSARADVLALQWLNANVVLALTASALEVYDVRLAKLVECVDFNPSSLVSPTLSYTTNGVVSYTDSVAEVAHSMRVYKSKVFLLGRSEVRVGTLLSWADRILSFVQEGDFLSAIELTRLFYVGEAKGNKNGLPDDPIQLRVVVGEKMRELMVASARYAFSEDRMTDATHTTPDGRGVDRTALFEDLVNVYVRACIALGESELLFEDLFQYYDDCGITGIFLRQLEPFILDNTIHSVPPRITQRLIAMHEEQGHLDLVERVIWHIDPECLDVDQAVYLCRKHQLYDALIYVFTRAMKDYVSPVVELLGLVRKVQQYRRTLRFHVTEATDLSSSSGGSLDDESAENMTMNAYKIYPYLANVLSGLTYPSEEPLPREEAFQAKEDVYKFIFFGRSSIWPVGEGGKLVLTADEEGGVEPTYPYLRLLLRFDAEAFLHSMDIAFEDAYLNDETQSVTRLIIVKILLEILSSSDLLPSDVTFTRIFVARNVPKYPQFIHLSPSALQNLLVGLATDLDQSTREDRQLAAEYLLSTYTPHENDRIVQLFENAGFFRILRTWHRQEQKWASLILTYLNDPDLRSSDIFPNIDEALSSASQGNKGVLPPEVLQTILDALPLFLDTSITSTAVMIDSYVPEKHSVALDTLSQDADHKRFAYLRCLLGPLIPGEEANESSPRVGGPSIHVDSSLRHLYISLQCQLEPKGVIDALAYLPLDFLDWSRVVRICEENQVFHAAIWALDRIGDPCGALNRAETFDKLIASKIADDVATGALEAEVSGALAPQLGLQDLQQIGETCAAICLDRSKQQSEFPVEDMWFQLLYFQIECVQNISGVCSPASRTAVVPDSELDSTVQSEQRILSTLGGFVQESFSALMTISSTGAVSFPRLFKRLVDSTTHAHASIGTPWTEFRTILTGMLESYRSEGDILVITKHMVDRDLFNTIEDLARDRLRGWKPFSSACASCRKDVVGGRDSEEGAEEAHMQMVVSRTGTLYHRRCLPPGIHLVMSSHH